MFISAPVGMLMGVSLYMLFLSGWNGCDFVGGYQDTFERIREEARENAEGEELNEIDGCIG